MGGIISAIIAGGAAAGAALAAAAEAAGLTITTYAVSTAAVAGGVELGSIAAIGAGGAATGLALSQSVALTTLGASLFAGIATVAIAGGIAGLALGLLDRGPIKVSGATLLDAINSQEPLICRLSLPDSENECRRLYTVPGKRTVRIQPRKTKERSVLSYATPSRVSRPRYTTASKSGNAAKRRKISNAPKQLRRKSGK